MKCFVAAIILLHALTGITQDYRFKTYTTKDGLSSNTTRDAIKDKDGFLWIATTNGLNRFDGNAFDCFYNDPDNPHSIPSNETLCLYTDRQQRLWIGSLGGISLYDPVYRHFSNYYPDASAGKSGRLFCSIREDEKGKLWVGTYYELLIFDPADKKFQRSGWADFVATHKPAKGNNSRIVVQSLLKKSVDELWVLTSYGLYSVNTNTKQFTWYPYSGIDDYFGCQLQYADETGGLWIGTYNKGILHFDPSNNTWSQYHHPAGWNSVKDFDWSYSIRPYGKDTLLFGSLDGISFFDRQRKKFLVQLKHAPADAQSFPNTRTYNIIPDGNKYWLMTGIGLVCMFPPPPWFHKIVPFGPDAYISRVYPSPRSADEIIVFDWKKKELVFWNETSRRATTILPANGKPIRQDIISWSDISPRELWFSTDDTMYRFDKSSGKVTTLELPASQFPANEKIVRNAVMDKDGIIWIRLRSQGIIRYDTLTKHAEFINFIPPAEENAYPALYYNKTQHSLWVALEHGGVYQYKIASKETVHYPLPVGNAYAKSTITGITGDEKGNMYLSDVSNGVFKYNIADHSFTLLTMKDGLPGNNSNNVVIDKIGNIWIAGSQGLGKIDVRNNDITDFNALHLFPEIINYIAVSPSGQLYTTPDNNCYYKWDPSAIASTGAAVVPYIRNISINQQPVALQNSYELDYRHSNISLRIGSIVPDDHGPVEFEYRLNGDVWTRMENTHTVNFSNLAAGKYQLDIRQKGFSGTLSLAIRIRPPFWKTSWFMLALLAAIGLLIFVLVRRRIRYIRRQASLKQRVAESEMMALRAQMNPHFIFNCISSIDNFIQDNDKENASAWLNKFAKLIRNILDSSRNEVVPFWKDWETLRMYLELEQLRSDNKFEFIMEADPALLNGHYRVPPLVIQPYVENAIHHGLLHLSDNKGVLRITATSGNQQLHYRIEDNGIGREKAAALQTLNRFNHSSYGMQMSRERIALFNEQSDNHITITDLHHTDGTAVGTRVEVILEV